MVHDRHNFVSRELGYVQANPWSALLTVAYEAHHLQFQMLHKIFEMETLSQYK